MPNRKAAEPSIDELEESEDEHFRISAEFRQMVLSDFYETAERNGLPTTNLTDLDVRQIERCHLSDILVVTSRMILNKLTKNLLLNGYRFTLLYDTPKMSLKRSHSLTEVYDVVNDEEDGEENLTDFVKEADHLFSKFYSHALSMKRTKDLAYRAFFEHLEAINRRV